MEIVQVHASREYEVRIGSGLLPGAGAALLELYPDAPGRPAVLVSDDIVYPLYGELVRESLRRAGFPVHSFVFPHGEAHKTLTTYGKLLDFLCDRRIPRSAILIALGGGVVGDLTGFAAATWQRGVDFVQLPTTLLAAVDSSVGGKTAVDLTGGKNLAGAFYQPALVLCDTDALSSLPEAEYSNGCAEIIKYAMIGSRPLFDSLLRLPVSAQFEPVIRQCVEMKRGFVEADEQDRGCRMMLNFGHTIGHAIESCSRYAVPHGSAVAAGMAVITKAACALGLCGLETYELLLEALSRYRLPAGTFFSREQLCRAALSDKKRSGTMLTLIIPEEIGHCVLRPIPQEALSRYLKLGGVQ